MPDLKEYNRAVAIKIPILQLLQGTYIQEKEQNPNYLLTTDNQKIYRLNILGIIINKEQVGTITNLILDDGTENIIIRSFEENKNILNSVVGDIIQVIGKIRIFNEEKYISPEIVKKVNPLWLKIRSIEMEKLYHYEKSRSEQEITKNELKEKKDNTEKIAKIQQKSKLIENITETEKKEYKKSKEKIIGKKEENKEHEKENITKAKIEKNNEEVDEIEEVDKIKEVDEDSELPSQKMFKLIKELDEGDGALIEDIIEKSPLNEPEKMIEKMLEKGDIFQNQPGKVKVL